MLNLRPPPVEGRAPEPELTGRGGPRAAAHEWLFLASLVLALLPVVIASARAVRRDWLPIGDNAYFSIRAHDVLTEHHPLLGTWTSASRSAGTDFNNPGPLLFDLFAAPVKLLGGDARLAVGVALLNCVAIVGVALAARRIGGVLTGTVAVAMTAVLAWTMGSELLYDPWQPHSLLFSFLLFVVLTWALASGDVWSLPPAVGVASLVAQTHLSYAVLIAALGSWGVVGLGLELRRRRRDVRWPARRRAAARAAGVTVVVLAVCWAQPIVEQVTGPGEGNLSRLATDAGAGTETLGVASSVRLTAAVVAAPPWWLRPSFADTLTADEPGADGRVPDPDLPGLVPALALLSAVAVALAATWAFARHRGDRLVATAAVTAGVAVLASLATGANLPRTSLGIAPHQLRWLWPVAAFTTFVLVAGVLRALGPRRRVHAVLATAAVVAMTSVANLESHLVPAGPASDRWAIPVMHRLAEEMVALEGGGPYLIDMRGIRFAEPFSGPVMAELQRRGIPFVVDDEGMVRQLGPSRRAEGGETRLFIRDGPAVGEAPFGSRRAVLVEGLEGPEQAELDELAAAVSGQLRALGRVPLNERGFAALERGDVSVSEAQPPDLGAGPDQTVWTDDLLTMVEEDLLDLDPAWEVRFQRWAELQNRFGKERVALFLEPADDAVG